MRKLKQALLVSALTLASAGANAEIITFGDLSTDATYNVIADTVIGREYLRLDTFQLTYAQTLAATGAGAAYDGWTLVDSAISVDFFNAILSQTIGNELTGWQDGIFGNAYHSGDDIFAYVSTGGTQEVGIGVISSGGATANNNSWSSFAVADLHHAGTGTPINFLLYRENSLHIGGYNTDAAANNLVGEASVPAPASLGLLAIAMLGFSARRKSK